MKYRNFSKISFTVALFLVISTIRVEVPYPTVEIGNVSVMAPTEEYSHKSQLFYASLTVAENASNSILFVGDVLLARNVEVLMKRYGSDYPYQGISFRDVAENPFVVGNFEASAPNTHKLTKSFVMSFSVDSVHLPAAKEAGFTHFSLANNHALDNGKDGFISTVNKLRDADFQVFGSPENLSKESVSFVALQEKTVAIIGIYGLANQFEQSELDSLLKYASSKSDFQIIYVHWGTEYENTSSPVQKALAKKLVTAGADLIIGHHPHVVQEVSVIEGVPVFYSLGNYIFDQYFSQPVQEGLVLSLDFSADSTVSLIPVTSLYSKSQPSLMTDTAAREFLLDLSSRSDADLRPYIINGVLPLNSLVATSSKMAMIN